MPIRSDDRKPTSWTARVLAPILLVAVAAAIVLVISDSLSEDDSGKDSTRSSTTADTGCTPAADQAVKDGFYVVKLDDNFPTSASKTGISIERLQELNPNLDSVGLQPQNCVDLVPDGCKKLAG